MEKIVVLVTFIKKSLEIEVLYHKCVFVTSDQWEKPCNQPNMI